MKVLWFTNIPMPQMLGASTQNHKSSGGWMMALLEQLSQKSNIELSVICAAPGLKETEISLSENLHFYSISQGPAWRFFAFNNPDDDLNYLQACSEVVKKVNPDIIHIHGTERFYGLIGSRNLSSAPVVISIQGLLHDYVRFRHYFGVTTLIDIIAMHDLFHLVRGMGSVPDYLKMRRAAKRELEILRGNRWFMGRTLWDRAHLRAVNQKAHYFHVPELLRPSFYGSQWNITTCQRYRIIFTNANSYRRGVEILLDAVAILRQNFPNVCLVLAGGVEQLPYGKRIRQRIAMLGIQEIVEFSGQLNEEQMIAELCKAHIFAISSLVENSPNSLCEAQLVGVPCVASYVGGIPSLIEEGRTGLLFPSGDAMVLAERIREVFINDELAYTLGTQARQVALERHAPEVVTRSVMETYETVIQQARAGV